LDASALLGEHEAVLGQQPDGLAGGVARRAVLRGQLPLGRELLTGADHALLDRLS